MKVGMGLLNVATVANSAGNHVNPSWLGMVDPVGRCLMLMVRQRTVICPSYGLIALALIKFCCALATC